MRILKVAISFIIVLAMLVPMSSFAYFDEMDVVCVNKGTPTIDGTINSDEGWSDAIAIDQDTAAVVYLNDTLPINATAYLAFDEDFLYFSADITELITQPWYNRENLFSPSVLTDDGLVFETYDFNNTDFGFSGDVFSFAVDPLSVLTNAEKYDQRAPMYNVAYDAEGNGAMFHSNCGEAGILNDTQAKVAVTLNDTGWVFEAAVSMDVVVEDIIANSGVSVDRNDITTSYDDWKASFIYKASKFSTDAEEYSVSGVCSTVADYTHDLYPGQWTNGMDVKTFGLTFYLNDEDLTPQVDYVVPFVDVKKDAWYAEGIKYCLDNKYVSGVTATTFCPDDNLTRAQFVTLLANLDGVDLSQYADVENAFSDVNKGQWFYNAVTWAATEGYANGVGNGKFDPDANVTRAQLAKFFYVYSEKNGGDMTPTNDLSDFSDGTNVPAWAVDYIKWAVGSGLIAGMNGAVNGDGFATRAQAAKIFMNFDNIK